MKLEILFHLNAYSYGKNMKKREKMDTILRILWLMSVQFGGMWLMALVVYLMIVWSEG